MAMIIKVLSYNIHKGDHWSGLKESLSQMKELIHESGADIVLLQEIVGEKIKKSSKKIPQLEFLADTTWDHFSYGKNATYTKGHHGNAILSKFPILETTNHDLSTNKLEQRGLLYGKIDLDPANTGSKELDVFCTHLNLLHKSRKKQYKMIDEIFCHHYKKDTPSIFAGDFNDWNKKSLQFFNKNHNYDESYLLTHGKLPKTFPSFMPLLSLDRFYTRGVKILKATTITESKWRNFSDHLALYVEIEV
ncbi:MAG: endonuclease/exonuclease/phosphatase family protein [Gammaproteobacteria bacterium]|nr:endonuclease/exonuclease/phosphatase family protein [Gammaproteobacteria bacterium]